MKVTINQAELSNALSITGKPVTNGILPALNNYLFTFDSDHLHISGSNLQVFVTTTISYKGEEVPKPMMVPAKRIIDLVKELVKGDIETEIIEKETDKGEIFFNFTIFSGRGVYTIPCESGENFPKMLIDRTAGFNLDTAVLNAGITKALFALSKDDLRPNLTGVYMAITAKSVTFTGCDGFVLSTHSYTIKTKADLSLIIPPTALIILQSCTKKDSVSINASKNNVEFDLGNGTVIQSTLIDEKYPDYQSVIPISHVLRATVNVTDFTSSVRRASLFSSFVSKGINLKVGDGKIVIHARNDFNEVATEDFECQTEGESVDIWVNSTQFLPLLNRIESEQVTLFLTASNKAIVLKENSDTPESKSDLMLVMPTNP